MHQLKPGEALIQEISIDFPEHLSGRFRFCFDLVSESVCWFEQLGHNQNALKYFVFKRRIFIQRVNTV